MHHFLPPLLLLFDAPFTLGMSPIHAAVEENNPTAVRAALSDGADVNEVMTVGDENHTPIVHAVLSDKLRAAAALMKMGADATIRSHEGGFTPMHIAAEQGNGKILRLLIRYGVDTNEMHSDGLTPFHRACLGSGEKHTDAVFALLDGGVPPDQPSAEKKLPIDMAGSLNTRKLLMEGLQEKRRKGR